MSLGPRTLKAGKPMPYPEVPSTLGDRLRNRRHEHGLLHKDAADGSGVNAWALSSWEKGCTNPKLRFWPGIIEFLGYHPNPGPNPSDLAQRSKTVRIGRDLSEPADVLDR